MKKFQPAALSKGPGMEVVYPVQGLSNEYSYSRHQIYRILDQTTSVLSNGTKYKTSNPKLSLSATSRLLMLRLTFSRRLLTNFSRQIPIAAKRNPTAATFAVLQQVLIL